MALKYLLWGRKKMNQSQNWIIFRKMKIFQRYFGWESTPIISFFCTYPLVHRPLSFEDRSENVIFKVFKTVKKVIPDTNFWAFVKLVWWIFWISGFCLKQSIAIFCTIQNRFWTRFDWFRQDWKSRVLDENQCFFS